MGNNSAASGTLSKTGMEAPVEEGISSTGRGSACICTDTKKIVDSYGFY
jgi:hypothetical protein